MSERDLQRIEVLSRVTAGRMTVVSAAHAQRAVSFLHSLQRQADVKSEA